MAISISGRQIQRPMVLGIRKDPAALTGRESTMGLFYGGDTMTSEERELHAEGIAEILDEEPRSEEDCLQEELDEILAEA